MKRVQMMSFSFRNSNKLGRIEKNKDTKNLKVSLLAQRKRVKVLIRNRIRENKRISRFNRQ